MSERILLIEDEKALVMALQDRLESEGYLVDARYDGRSGEEEALRGGYACLVLDVMLPERDGFQVCRNLRSKGMTVPVLMLTARSTNIDTVMGLKLGADDYLTKPFDMQVLLARIEALIRRAKNPVKPAAGPAVFRFGAFTLDTGKRLLTRNDERVELNAVEYRLLEYLVIHPGDTLSRDRLLDEVWGYDPLMSSRTVDVHVARLRRKLDEGDIPVHLHTIRGLGYRFVSESR